MSCWLLWSWSYFTIYPKCYASQVNVHWVRHYEEPSLSIRWNELLSIYCLYCLKISVYLHQHSFSVNYLSCRKERPKMLQMPQTEIGSLGLQLTSQAPNQARAESPALRSWFPQGPTSCGSWRRRPRTPGMRTLTRSR